MNNKQKFQQTVLKVQEIRKIYGESLEKRIAIEDDLKEKFRLSQRNLAILELDFLGDKPFYTFCSASYGAYRLFKCNKKRRVYSVPMCYCVTLYQHDLERVFSKDKVQIPFSLRGFWKMQKALQLMEDFVGFQNKVQNVLLWEQRRLENANKRKAAKYSKILDELMEMRTINSGWKKSVSYRDFKFVINTKNVKLDIVPLCQILTRYYANVITRIDQYLETYSSKVDEQKLEDIKEEFTKLMERYFVYIP